MSNLKERLGNSSNDNQNNNDAEQSKSLIANTYSNRGSADPESYKELDDWELTDEEIQLAYDVTRGGGVMRRAAKSMAASGSHEEWYSELQVKLANYVADILNQDLPNGESPEGPIPLMEFLALDEQDIVEYLRSQEDAQMALSVLEELQDNEEALREAAAEQEE